MIKARYLIDTNVFIRFESGNLYDKACFPKHYDNFIELLNEGKAISLDKVKKELIKGVEGKKIYNDCKNSFKPYYFEGFEETYEKLLNTEYSPYFKHYANDLPNSADPFLIIYAYHHNMCLVTQEVPKKKGEIKNYKIPNICSELGATCIDNENLKNKVNSYEGGFGCICFTELIRIEELYK